ATHPALRRGVFRDQSRSEFLGCALLTRQCSEATQSAQHEPRGGGERNRGCDSVIREGKRLHRVKATRAIAVITVGGSAIAHPLQVGPCDTGWCRKTQSFVCSVSSSVSEERVSSTAGH